MHAARSEFDPLLHLPPSELSDEELSHLAMAHRADESIDADALPLDLTGSLPSFLPGWYMPPVMQIGTQRWHRWAIAAVIIAFAAIDAFGLCSTYGPLTA